MVADSRPMRVTRPEAQGTPSLVSVRYRKHACAAPYVAQRGEYTLTSGYVITHVGLVVTPTNSYCFAHVVERRGCADELAAPPA